MLVHPFTVISSSKSLEKRDVEVKHWTIVVAVLSVAGPCILTEGTPIRIGKKLKNRYKGRFYEKDPDSQIPWPNIPPEYMSPRVVYSSVKPMHSLEATFDDEIEGDYRQNSTRDITTWGPTLSQRRTKRQALRDRLQRQREFNRHVGKSVCATTYAWSELTEAEDWWGNMVRVAQHIDSGNTRVKQYIYEAYCLNGEHASCSAIDTDLYRSSCQTRFLWVYAKVIRHGDMEGWNLIKMHVIDILTPYCADSIVKKLVHLKFRRIREFAPDIE
ncbi:neurotrophin-3-like [Lineus longissimus]|uniref:neurotrophin-3-like n=1 Tax=Lineus longissimus TaxID=88925 RepID=UPI00315C4CF3